MGSDAVRPPLPATVSRNALECVTGFAYVADTRMINRDYLLILACACTLASPAILSSAEPTWEQGEGFRRRQLAPTPGGKPGFTLMVDEAVGIHWTNSLPPEKYMERQNLMNGAGVALGDFDNDGWCDIYLCGKFAPNALYRNLGNWKFEDVTAKAGVGCTNQTSNGAVFADINGDGLLDLLVTSFTGPNACFLNLGDGHFTNITERAGLLSKGGTTSQALGDLDGDGDLDLYVMYFGIEAILRDGASFSTRMVNGRTAIMGKFAKRLAINPNGRLIEFGEPDALYRNKGSGTFEPIRWEEAFLDENGQPAAAPNDFGLAIQIRDVNGDGLPDIYTCNDFHTPDRLWLNDGHGKFKAVDRLALRNMSYASMGVDFADIDRDGNLDFITVEMLSRDHRRHGKQMSPKDPTLRQIGQIDTREDVARNVLNLNRGDGTYADIAWFSGVAASDWSWTPIFMDVDLDGYDDLLISNGHLHDVNDRDMAWARPAPGTTPTPEQRRMLLRYPRLDTPNVAFHNRRDRTFEDASQAWGFNSRQITHGMALADLDNDGDLDLVANCANAGPLVYRNETAAPRVAVRLKGKAPNTQSIGAKVTLRGGPFPQSQEILCGGRYLSGDDTGRAFAVPNGSHDLEIEVRWRSGFASLVKKVEPNFLYEIDESSAVALPKTAPVAAAPTPMFEDVSARINHTHHEDPYDDFARQPLLPKRLSQLGPGISWFDVNGDGRDDLVIGSGKGGDIAIFQNEGQGGFKVLASPNLKAARSDDTTTILGTHANGRSFLLVGNALYEGTRTNAAVLGEYFVPSAENGAAFCPSTASGGPVAMADVDGDGTLDLFVGGRFVPGHYPQAASSFLFQNDGLKFGQTEASAKLTEAGLVSGATFSDLDGDGLPELILACEWGPVRVYKFKITARSPLASWEMREITSELGLSGHAGLWSSVVTGDFDGDGRMDIVAGNWGKNSAYQRSREGPWYVYYGDFNGDGRTEILEAYFDPGLKEVVPWRDLNQVTAELPWVRTAFATHQAYSSASVKQVLGAHFAQAKELKATTLATTIFWNRGGHFEAEALPAEAQWSAVYGMNVADFNGDGIEDLFLAQNFFAARPEEDRLDAGRGLLLLGQAGGKFLPMGGQESGLKIYGEQRGSAVSDFDGDGRVDLCVSQNGAATKLYQNRGGKPGVRVRLKGASSNPDGIGAVLRVRSNGQPGPAREIHAGSGYWSQDSTLQVLALPPGEPEIVVRWPGGKETVTKVREGMKEVVIDSAAAQK